MIVPLLTRDRNEYEEEDQYHYPDEECEELEEQQQEDNDDEDDNDEEEYEDERMWTIEMKESQNRIYYNLPHTNTTNEKMSNSTDTNRSKQRMTATEMRDKIRAANSNIQGKVRNYWCFHLDPFVDDLSLKNDLYLLCSTFQEGNNKSNSMEELQICFLGGIWDHQQAYDLFQQLVSLGITTNLRHLIIEWVDQGDILQTLYQLAKNNNHNHHHNNSSLFLSLSKLSLYNVNFSTEKDCYHFAYSILQKQQGNSKTMMPQLQNVTLCSCSFPSLTALFYIIDGLSTRVTINTTTATATATTNNNSSNKNNSKVQNDGDHNEILSGFDCTIIKEEQVDYPKSNTVLSCFVAGDENDNYHDNHHNEMNTIPSLKENRFLQFWHQSHKTNDNDTSSNNRGNHNNCDHLFVTAQKYFEYHHQSQLNNHYFEGCLDNVGLPNHLTTGSDGSITSSGGSSTRQKRALLLLDLMDCYRRRNCSYPAKRQRISSSS